jgi:hypothetical protein
MSRILQLFIGPEFLWLLIYAGAALLAKLNDPPSKAIDKLIENSWFYIPVLALLSFGLWYAPGVEKNWLLLRVWIASVVVGHYAMEKAMGAYSVQGPGIGMGYLAGMMLLFVILIAGSVFVKIRF